MGEVTKTKPSPKCGTNEKFLSGKSSRKKDILPTSKPVSTATKLPSRSSYVQRLPHELLGMICRFLLEPTSEKKCQPPYSRDLRTALRINRSSLKAFGATCRSIHATVQTLLFQEIIFFNTLRSTYLRLLRTLEARPHWQSVIESVEFAWFPSLSFQMMRAGPPSVTESVAGKAAQAQDLKRRLEPWFYKRMTESFFCDRSKPQWSTSRNGLVGMMPEVYEDNALCMMLLSQLSNLRRARIQLPQLEGNKWRRHFDSRNLRWPPQNTGLASLKELQLFPEARGRNFAIFAATSVLNCAPNLETLVLIDGAEPIVSVAALKLSQLRSLVLKDCGLFLKPHTLKLLVRPCRQLRHFQIDFFDHKQSFKFGTNYARDVWDRYFTHFEIDWQETPTTMSTFPHYHPIKGAQQVTLTRYCTAASNLLHALSHVSSTLETIYLGQLSKTLESTRGRIRIRLKRGVQPLSSFKAFPKLKRLCIDVRMIHQIRDSNKPSALVDLIKDCPDFEALMLYGVDHVNLEDTGSFAHFARAVDGKETFPSLKKVVILADDYKGRDLDVNTRKLSALAGVWSRENGNKDVELAFLMDDGLCG